MEYHNYKTQNLSYSNTVRAQISMAFLHKRFTFKNALDVEWRLESFKIGMGVKNGKNTLPHSAQRERNEEIIVTVLKGNGNFKVKSWQVCFQD